MLGLLLVAIVIVLGYIIYLINVRMLRIILKAPTVKEEMHNEQATSIRR